MVLLTDEDLEEEDLQEGKFVTMWLSRQRMKLKLPKGKCLNLLLFINHLLLYFSEDGENPRKRPRTEGQEDGGEGYKRRRVDQDDQENSKSNWD